VLVYGKYNEKAIIYCSKLVTRVTSTKRIITYH